MSGTVRALESALSEKQELLQSRSRELKAAKSKVNTLRERLAAIESAKKQTETLQQQLKQKTELLQSRSRHERTAGKLTRKVQALENQIEEKEKLLNDRDAKLEAIGSEANVPNRIDPARKRAVSAAGASESDRAPASKRGHCERIRGTVECDGSCFRKMRAARLRGW